MRGKHVVQHGCRMRLIPFLRLASGDRDCFTANRKHAKVELPFRNPALTVSVPAGFAGARCQMSLC